MIELEYAGERIRIGRGEVFRFGAAECYRDTSSNTVHEIIRDITRGEPWRSAVAQRFQVANKWLFDIVTHPSRSMFFDSLPLSPQATVLDVGSGWGQIALALAGNGHQVCAVEPTPERLDFIRTVAAQESLLSHISFVNADYLSVEFLTRFDLIACVGVLEWVGAYAGAGDAQTSQRAFLAKMRRETVPGGRCVIGIENRLGLKYLLGAPDDHIGVGGVCVLDHALAERRWKHQTGRELRTFVYTMREYEQLLNGAGFEAVDFYAAYPDYKLPSEILPTSPTKTVNDYFLDGNFVEEHSGVDGTLLSCQEELRSHYRSLAELGIAQFFAPSYYIVAS